MKKSNFCKIRAKYCVAISQAEKKLSVIGEIAIESEVLKTQFGKENITCSEKNEFLAFFPFSIKFFFSGYDTAIALIAI